MENVKNYWNQKEIYSERAKTHTLKMELKYSEEIKKSINNTIEYSPTFSAKKTAIIYDRLNIELVDEDSVTAIFNHYTEEEKIAVLNFASYKKPGGEFINGSKAQEECLCHESFLYNVLKEKESYYNWNKDKHLNKAQYMNRALYSPDIIFARDSKEIKCDVITCAAPNLSPAIKYGWNVTKEENTRNLYSRIKFILDIAKENKVNILILGAFGCGVFRQEPEEVCSIFLDLLDRGEYYFKDVVFAIPKSTNGNYNAFKMVLEREG